MASPECGEKSQGNLSWWFIERLVAAVRRRWWRKVTSEMWRRCSPLQTMVLWDAAGIRPLPRKRDTPDKDRVYLQGQSIGRGTGVSARVSYAHGHGPML